MRGSDLALAGTLLGLGAYAQTGRRGGECSFHLPNIAENERIKLGFQKFRRHKHRRNKLHDKRKGRGK